jgi:hypothetical protein
MINMTTELKHPWPSLSQFQLAEHRHKRARTEDKQISVITCLANHDDANVLTAIMTDT